MPYIGAVTRIRTWLSRQQREVIINVKDEFFYCEWVILAFELGTLAVCVQYFRALFLYNYSIILHSV